MNKTQLKGVQTREKMMAFITDYFEKHGYAPTYREIANSLNVSSVSMIYLHMKKLFSEGRLESDLEEPWHCSRAFRIAREVKNDER